MHTYTYTCTFYEACGQRTNMMLTDEERLLEVTNITRIIDLVALRHFTDVYGERSPYVDRDGKPIAIIDTEQYASAKYRVVGKRGRLKRLTADNLRDVYVTKHELVLDVFAHYAESVAMAAIDLAVGAKTIRKDHHGNEIEVYDRPPDAKAIEIVLNRLMGKPSEDRSITATVEQTDTKKVHVLVPDNGRRSEQISKIKALPKMENEYVDTEFVISPENYEPSPVSEVILNEFGI